MDRSKEIPRMHCIRSRHSLLPLVGLLVAIAPGQASAQGNAPPVTARARADSARYPYTSAVIRFMTGMIGHHAQAITMSELAPSRTDNGAIRTLAARIINAQRDEIGIMTRWLRERGQVVASADHAGHDGHAMMPGMLTPAQLQELTAARGREFDRLYLRLMIQHHEGAVTMVTELFGTDGAAQDQTVFRFASDVQVDQRTEIARMQRMLAAILFAPTAP
jgi:uncharacterized protein (DUF305 family)